MPLNSVSNAFRNADARNRPDEEEDESLKLLANKLLANTIREVEVAALKPYHRKGMFGRHHPDYCSYCIGLEAQEWVKEELGQVALWCDVGGWPAKAFRDYIMEYDLSLQPVDSRILS